MTITNVERAAMASFIGIYLLTGLIEPCDGHSCKGIAMEDDNQDFWQQQQQEEQQQFEEQNNAE